MSTAAKSGPAFHCFADLPPELRRQIWCESFPDDRGPALCLFQRGCWQLREPTATELQENTRSAFFCFDPFLRSRVAIQAAFVNREAYDLGQKWLRASSASKHDDKPYVFTLAFDFRRDAVYVSPSRLSEADKGCHGLWHWLMRFDVDIPQFPRYVAVSKALLDSNPNDVCHLDSSFLRVPTLLVVIDAPEDMLEETDDTSTRWEFRSLRNGTYYFNPDMRCYQLKPISPFCMRRGGYLTPERQDIVTCDYGDFAGEYEEIEAKIRTFVDPFVDRDKPWSAWTEVRPVIAMKI